LRPFSRADYTRRLIVVVSVVQVKLPEFRRRCSTLIHAMQRFGLLVATGSIFASPALHAAGEHHWSYSGDTGPVQWAALESDYSVCGVGKLRLQFA
jgi:hypothetical protein